MLNLSRRTWESVVITLPDGERITITVTKVTSERHNSRQKTVGLGFEAPRNLTINRKEIQDKIDAENPSIFTAKEQPDATN